MKCEKLLAEIKEYLEIMESARSEIKEEALKLAGSPTMRRWGFDDEFVLRSDPLKIGRRVIDLISRPIEFKPAIYELCIDEVCFNYMRFFTALDNYITAQKEVRRRLKWIDICKF
jgi:hypothetical protein